MRRVRTYESDLFGTLASPSSFDELLPLLHLPYRPRAAAPGRSVRIWRGQGNIEWPVHSTAYRRLAGPTLRRVSDQDLRSYEENLLDRAEHRGFRFHEGRALSDLELLARLRHHGAATRFVDATRSALIGLWFCVSDQQNKVGLVLGIHCSQLGGMPEGMVDKRPYNEIVQDLPDTHPQNYDPPRVSVRVAAQHSHFLYSPIVTEKTGSLALPKEEDATRLIAIVPDLKLECEQLLSEIYDIRREALFPDLDGFSIANSVHFDIKSAYRW
jgi:hypothetical protein